MSAGMVLLTSGYAVFTWMNSTNEFRAYYFISAILGAVSLIQCIKTWMGMLGCRQEGSGRCSFHDLTGERKQRVQLCPISGNMPGIPECDEKPDMGKSMVNRMLTKVLGEGLTRSENGENRIDETRDDYYFTRVPEPGQNKDQDDACASALGCAARPTPVSWKI